uniref:Uncharacterized protein n=1 Tax=Anopheles culicifacies TaxID=139723 RepID=A0A182M4Y3_9DIPT
MPTARHFWKRQNWHRFRRRLSTGQALSARQTYFEPFWTAAVSPHTAHSCDGLWVVGVALGTFALAVGVTDGVGALPPTIPPEAAAAAAAAAATSLLLIVFGLLLFM